MKSFIEQNNKVIGSLECDLFIIPNHAWSFHADDGCSYSNIEWMQHGRYWGCQLDDKLIEVWGTNAPFVPEDKACDNLHCHGYLPQQIVDLEALKEEYKGNPKLCEKLLARAQDGHGSGGVEITVFHKFGYPWNNHNRYWFPDYLPMSLFEGKKEGDTVQFDLGDSEHGYIRVTAHLAQSKYRYRSHGNGTFEGTLKEIQ